MSTSPSTGSRVFCPGRQDRLFRISVSILPNLSAAHLDSLTLACYQRFSTIGEPAVTIKASDSNITLDSLDSLFLYWRTPESTLQWDCFFVLPPWLKVWWRQLSLGVKLYSCAVKHSGSLIGIAPLSLKGEEACFIGSTDVCDYLDFVITPGNENEFFNVILDDLSSKGIARLSLSPVRPDSTVLTHLVDVAKVRGYEVSCKAVDVSLELNLPPTWEDYLGILNRKQRHEVRRKLRRLQEKGAVTYRTIEDSADAAAAVTLFLNLFRKNNNNKKIFMTTKMESFFINP